MTNQHILQVSELTKKVRFILESELNTVWLCGEISNFIAANSGHWYLSLKDSKSQVRCAMFKGNNRRVRITPSNGQQVLVRAKVSLYEPRGDFQLIIEQMEDAGEGLLKQKYEQLKNQLNNEGLFALEHKQTLPAHIKTVGIVTSATGAAVKDILTVLKRRNPTIKVVIYPALVQGSLAAKEITDAIKKANLRAECDVLLVGRGGGSLEDLWSFNEESVVRAIYASTIPIISAVGHEIDTTLSDYVADLRAPTPSAAAELVSQDKEALIEKIQIVNARLQNNILQKFATSNTHATALQHRLKQVHPLQQMQLQQQKLDEYSIRLNQAATAKIAQLSVKPVQLSNRLQNNSPLNNIVSNKQKNEQYQLRLRQALDKNFQQKKQDFVHWVEALNIVSPLATIARGYSVTKAKKGNIITSVNDVEINEEVSVQVSDGFLQAKVIDKQN